LNDCRHVTLHGIRGCNSPSWTFHPFYSEDVSLLDVEVSSPKTSPKTDGIDPEGCSGVRIIGCRISTGDDCIAIKSGKRPMAEKHRRAAEHHTIRNCLMQFGHGAVVFGSEMSGGIRDIEVSRCYFRNTDRGLRIKTRRGRGHLAVVDGVVFRDIVMDGVLMPLVINMYYNCDPLDGRSEYVWSREPHPVGEDTPYLGAFTFRDIVCTNCECVAGFFDGLPEQPIGSVRIENVSFSFREEARRLWPASQTYSRGFCREGLYFDHVREIELRHVSFENVLGDEVQLGSYESFRRE
jgi:polygalacturonase